MDIKKLEEKLKELKQPGYRIKQIKKAVFQDGISSFADMTNLPKNLRVELDREIDILSFKVLEIHKSKKRDSFKALLKLEDDSCIETVLMSPKKDTWSACISCQVGCALKCTFCATGRSGIKRNLSAGEICGQALFWRHYMNKNNIRGSFSNIVYMGMGEPFLNWDNLCKSLDGLLDPETFGFGSRSISVSTAGIPDKIVEFGEKYPQVNLAISLHFATDKKRSRYMPINRQYNLDKIKEAIEEYFKITKRKVFLEYIMLSGSNDSKNDASNLVFYIKSIENNYLLHVNLIRYNATAGGMKPSSSERVEYFQRYLEENKVSVTVRRSLGEEIKGACGQLAGFK